MSFKQHYLNAKTCIAQIKRGEWIPNWNPLHNAYLAAYRGGMRLWIANGSFFTDIDDKNYFGLLFRHWVWFAARPLRRTPGPGTTTQTPVLED